MDAQARVGGEPYADAQLDAILVVKRKRVLLELEVAGVLSNDSTARARLMALRLPRLLAYHDAAQQMSQYLSWSGRARLVKTPAPSKLVEGRVSRLVSPTIKMCPRVSLPSTHQLWFRTETSGPTLYRASSS
jgi:hypothetical protein